MTGFEPGSSGIGSNRSANCARFLQVTFLLGNFFWKLWLFYSIIWSHCWKSVWADWTTFLKGFCNKYSYKSNLTIWQLFGNFVFLIPSSGHTVASQHRTTLILILWVHATSVTRFGDLLDFGKLFKAFGNN